MSESTSSGGHKKENGDSHNDSNQITENGTSHRTKRKERKPKKTERNGDNDKLEELDVDSPETPKVKRKKKKAQAPIEQVPLKPQTDSDLNIEEIPTASDLSLTDATVSDGEPYTSDGSAGSTSKKHHLRNKLHFKKHHHHKESDLKKEYSEISTAPTSPRSVRSAHDYDEEDALAELLKATTSPTASRDPSRDHPTDLNAADYLRSVVASSPAADRAMPMLGSGIMGGSIANTIGSPKPHVSMSQVRSGQEQDDEPFSDSQAHLVDSNSAGAGAKEGARTAQGDASTTPAAGVSSPTTSREEPFTPPQLARMGTVVSPAELKRQATLISPSATDAPVHGFAPGAKRTSSPAASSSSPQHSGAEPRPGDPHPAANGAEVPDHEIPKTLPPPVAPPIKSNAQSSELGQYFYSRMHGNHVNQGKLAGERQKEFDKQAKKKDKKIAKARKHTKPEPGHEFDYILGGSEGETQQKIEQGTASHHLGMLNPHLIPESEEHVKAKQKMKFNREDGRFKYKGSVVRIAIADDKREDYEITKFSHNSWSGVRYYWVPDGQGRFSYITGEAQYIGEWKKGVRHGFGEGSCECKNVEGIYQGEWKSGKPSGQGKFLTKKFTVDGGWKDGQRHGFGDYHTEKLRYVGDWAEDKKNGYGIITYADGTRYEGEWEKDQRQGFGVCRYPDGSIYTGGWADNQRQGQGTSIYVNGNRYVGEWYKDMKQGQGALYGALHQKLYEGNWWRNKRHGQGTAWFVDTGDRYEGEWFLGKQHGEGDWFGADGSSYKGSYVDGFRQGTGLVIYASGDRYVGEWNRGSREGQLCAYVYKDYGKFVGPFVGDRVCGEGEYHTFANRKIAGYFEHKVIEDEMGRYQGLTLNGKRFGRGVQVYENGDRYDGEWRDGMRYGYGIMQYDDGGRYVGFWLKDQRSKLGTYSLPTGEKYVGRWLKDKRNGVGTMIFESKDRLVDAQWADDAPVDANGTFIFANKSVYRGPLKSGFPDGRGSLTMLISVLLEERAEYREKIGLHYFLRGEKRLHKEDVPEPEEGANPEKEDIAQEEDITQYVESAKRDKKAKPVTVFQPNTITFWRDFRKGRMVDGPGLSFWDGNAYEGDFIGYERFGVGKMMRTSGETYYGQWKHDREWGLGEVKTRSQDTYVGYWYNGFRNGVGAQSYDEGGTFYGKWMNDRRHGIGIFVWPDKSITTREYYKGELVSKRSAEQDWARKQLASWGVEKFTAQIKALPYVYEKWAADGLPPYYNEAMRATKPGDDSDAGLDAVRSSRADIPSAIPNTSPAASPNLS